MFSSIPVPYRFNDAFDRLFKTNFFENETFRADIRREEDHYLLEAELPGFQKEDITLDLKEGILTIRAEHKEDHEEKTGDYIRRERRYGSYTRSFDISGIDEENISAAYENGILKLRLPKVMPVEPETRKISIQ
jgi:HSP20 family protein